MKKVFGDVIAQTVEDDGLIVDPASIQITKIKEEQEYEGLRVNFLARLERARISLQVDIGFGDAIVPAPQEIEYPGILDFPKATLRAYPRETVVAEKLEALVKLGMAGRPIERYAMVCSLPPGLLEAPYPVHRANDPHDHRPDTHGPTDPNALH
jgi:hypothetical protein